jgi:hypothetical protein
VIAYVALAGLGGLILSLAAPNNRILTIVWLALVISMGGVLADAEKKHTK